MGQDDDEPMVHGYFSLSFKEVSLARATISKSQVQKISGGMRRETVRGFLIGQLAKNEKVPTTRVNMARILEEIYIVLMRAQKAIGGRVILLECDDTESLVRHYKCHGFNSLTKDPDGMLVMYKIFKPSPDAGIVA